MSNSIRSLPVIQNWECQSCSDCCRIEAVVTDEEKRRIEALDLRGDAEVAAEPWFAVKSWSESTWSLRHRPDGSCVFLTAGNRCRLQERFGAEAKPLVCRLFPFVLVPGGSHWHVGLRYSCPSAAANRGRPTAEAELATLARLLEQRFGRTAESAPPPTLQPGQQVSWPDAWRIVRMLIEIVEDRNDRLERRLRKCLALARVCRQSKMENLSGGRLVEFLKVIRGAVETETPRQPEDVPPPSRMLGKGIFRALLAVYARRDRRGQAETGFRNRLSRVSAGWSFVWGQRRVPRVNEFLPDVRFGDIERATGTPAEIDLELERYYLVKLQSLQFFGPPNFDLPFWAGLDSLILTLPMILWLRRAFIDMPATTAVHRAIEIVDDHFGGDPMLGLPHIRTLQRTLAERGQLERLVAWYGR